MRIMTIRPSTLRGPLIGLVALGGLALAGCVAEVPPRPGVDYGYVAGGGYVGSAPAPYYGDPYYYDGYYGYAPGYYGPSATFVYRQDHYYPVYRNPPHSYRHDYHDGGHDDHDGDHGHHDGGPGNGGPGGNGGNHGGGWNHDRPGRPDGHVNGTPPPRLSNPQPVGRPQLGGSQGRPIASGGGRPARPAAPARPQAPPQRQASPPLRLTRGDDRR